MSQLYEDKKIECKKCNKSFILRLFDFPYNTEPSRTSSYECPYCNASYPIYLSKREDILVLRIEK